MDSDFELSAKLSGGKEFKFVLPAGATGRHVRSKISELSAHPEAQLKILFGGKYVGRDFDRNEPGSSFSGPRRFLIDEETLANQNIKKSTKFLVLLVRENLIFSSVASPRWAGLSFSV